MVVVRSYRPQWPDELELYVGDIIVVLSKHEEERWFGRLQGGQRGYFPASCVVELSQVGLVPEWAQQCSFTGTVLAQPRYVRGSIVLSVLHNLHCRCPTTNRFYIIYMHIKKKITFFFLPCYYVNNIIFFFLTVQQNMSRLKQAVNITAVDVCIVSSNH